MNRKSFIAGQICALTLCSFAISAQVPAEPEEHLNFGYSKNPPAKSSAKPGNGIVEKQKKNGEKTADNNKQPVKRKSLNESASRFESVAKMTREIAKEESRNALKPTEIYKVGSGDVLFIGLEESRSNYFTVLQDGSIDFPLVGGLVPVSGLTVEEIEEVLREEIQLYEDPEVSVKVREYASHGIDVLGLAARAGKQYLQREAMPLYVVRASAVVESAADIVIIKRSGTEDISIKRGEAGFDETLVYPGDVVEFVSSASRAAEIGFVYIGGAIKENGRFDFHLGMTLTQAIMAAGGTADSKVRKAIIRRKNDSGFLESSSYNLSDIKKGRSKDPVLQPGDMIEVGS